MGGLGSYAEVSPARDALRYSSETPSAKEAKRLFDCSGNHLGCPIKGIDEVAVRTKWQSGTAVGNAAARVLMGNRLVGNER